MKTSTALLLVAAGLAGYYLTRQKRIADHYGVPFLSEQARLLAEQNEGF